MLSVLFLRFIPCINRNLCDPAGMTSALKCGCEELVEYCLGFLIADETTWQDDDVGVIVLADKLGNVLVPSQSGTNTLMLVQRDCHAFATAADANSRVNLTALNGFSQWMGEVRIVTTDVTVSTEVLKFIVVLLQILNHKLLQRKSGVIAGKSNCFYFHGL